MARRTPADEAKRNRIMRDNPTLNRGQQSSTAHGNAAEHKLAKRLGGQLTAGSGNKADKADINLPGVKMEVKSTLHRQLQLKLDWLIKVSEQALRVGKRPVLAVQFTDRNGNPLHRGSWVMIPEDDYRELTGYTEEA